MLLTPGGLPVSLRPTFQEYVLENLDLNRDAFTIIERTLAYGQRDELRWLFSVYGADKLAAWVQQSGWRLLPRRRLLFWGAYFSLENLPQRKGAWPH